MDDFTARSRRPVVADRQSFPRRTNPNRPPECKPGPAPAAEHQDRAYPEKCHPHRSRPPLDSEQQDLAASYLPLARSLARRMHADFPGGDDEFRSAAFLALVEAAQSYDRTRNVNFATYARHRIWGALCDLRREMIGSVRPEGFGAAVAVIRLGSNLPDGRGVIGSEPDVPVGTELENLDAVENWIRKLPRPHARAFRHIYLDGKSQEETAALVGCSKSCMSRLHSQALTWLQQTYRSQAAEPALLPAGHAARSDFLEA